MFMTSAPSRLPASSKELCVRVEASKNRLISVRPRRTSRFLLICAVAVGGLVGEVEQGIDFARADSPSTGEEVAAGEVERFDLGDSAGH